MTTPTTSSAKRTTIPWRVLDHVAFLDYFSSQAALWSMPGEESLLRVGLDQRAMLRVSDPFSRERRPYTVAEVLSQGEKITCLATADTPMATALARLRRRPGARRLVLAAELQRRHLFPEWVEWFRRGTQAEDAIDTLDIYLIRFRGQISFAELALLADMAPMIGPGMPYTLFAVSPARATRLLAGWAETGETDRFRAMGDHFNRLLWRQHGTPPMSDLSTDPDWPPVWQWLNDALIPAWQDAKGDARFLHLVNPDGLRHSDTHVREWMRPIYRVAGLFEVSAELRRDYIDSRVIGASHGVGECRPDRLTLVRVPLPGGVTFRTVLQVTPDRRDVPGGVVGAWCTDKLALPVQSLERDQWIVGTARWFARAECERAWVAEGYRAFALEENGSEG